MNAVTSFGALSAASRICSPERSGSTSSASIQKIQSPVACFSDSFRAAANESGHGSSCNCTPNSSAISGVRSVLPVSTTMISEKNGFALSRHALRTLSSFLTIMQSEMRAFLARRVKSDRSFSGFRVSSKLTRPRFNSNPGRCEAYPHSKSLAHFSR